MKTSSEPIYLYCRNKTYYATPSIDLALKRADQEEILVLNNTPKSEE